VRRRAWGWIWAVVVVSAFGAFLAATWVADSCSLSEKFTWTGFELIFVAIAARVAALNNW
jgi:hypothetical protein